MGEQKIIFLKRAKYVSEFDYKQKFKRETRGKRTHYTERQIRIITDFMSETMQIKIPLSGERKNTFNFILLTMCFKTKANEIFAFHTYEYIDRHRTEKICHQQTDLYNKY